MNRAKEMKFIRISINEFKALLNRACEAYYGHKYDFEDTAAIIQWLELHELMGVVNFLEITNVDPKKLKLLPVISEDQKKRFVFRNQDHSLIHTSSIITDMTLAKCHQDNLCHTNIINILDPIAILPSLIRCSQKGYHAKAWWTDSEKNLLHMASINPNEKYPSYSIIKINTLIPNNNSDLDLICSRNRINSIESSIKIQPISNKENIIQEISVSEFKQYYNHKIINGLHIKTNYYQKLLQIADQILVEASEQSRLGAGE
jgi:hypothetical protein